MIDFIGIGVTKAGTTWLYDRLRELKEFRLTPIKELHYFDRSPEYSISPDYLEITKFRDRVFFNKRWYIRFAKDIGRTILQYPSFYDFKWVLKWHTANYSDEAYSKMFPSYDSRISGEITPAYSFLKIDDIKRMFKINNDLKIVLMIRDPIDRAWSHCRYRKPTVLGSIDDIKAFIDSDEQELRSNYLASLKNYCEVFPRENILVGFYDGIRDQPNVLLSQVVGFLGGNPDDAMNLSTLQKKSNVSQTINMPDEIYSYLKEKYESDIFNMANQIGSYCNNWLEKHYGIKNVESLNSPSLKANQIKI